MEAASLAKRVLGAAAERDAGQAALRAAERLLRGLEACARWALPPPVEVEDRPAPELVRPLPWVAFLVVLVCLRVARETLSLLYLALGKPPLRAADVVTYIQGRRRYVRTLLYQGGRAMRARRPAAHPAHTAPAAPRALRSLLQLAMCATNNTDALNNDDEVLVVRGADPMDRLLEQMMADLEADSDDEATYTLANVSNTKSNEVTSVDTDEGTGCRTSERSTIRASATSSTSVGDTQPAQNKSNDTPDNEKTQDKRVEETKLQSEPEPSGARVEPAATQPTQPPAATKQKQRADVSTHKLTNKPDRVKQKPSSKEQTKNFIQNEIRSSQKHKSTKKIANGRGARPAPGDARVPEGSSSEQ